MMFCCSSSNRFGKIDLLESKSSVLNLLKILKTFADPQDPITACIQQSHAANINLTFDLFPLFSILSSF